MERCFKLYRYMDLYWHCWIFFCESLIPAKCQGDVSCKLIAKKVKWKMNENFGRKWGVLFHFIPRFDIQTNTYSSISTVNFHKKCNIVITEKKLLFSFLTKFILVLLAHGEKSSKLHELTDGNRFPSFKPLFSKFLSRFLFKLATSNNSNF